MPSATVPDVGHNLIRDLIKSGTLYVAVGTGTTSPSSSDTKLVTEVFRKPVTLRNNGSSVGEGLITVSIGPGEATNVAIREVGFFGGPTATIAKDSGTLIARALYSHTHNPPGSTLETLQLQLDITS